MPKHIEMKEIFEQKARMGDGAFAIAWAIINLADAQDATSKAIQALGVAGASSPFGALEALGMQVEKAAEAIRNWVPPAQAVD